MNLFENISQEKQKKWFGNFKKGGLINTRFIILGIIGVILLILSGLLDSSGKFKMESQQAEIKNIPVSTNKTYEEIQEAKLSNVLSQLKGAGSVTVSITYESSSIQEHAKNITKESKVIQEKDTSGGIRTTTESKETEQILVNKENGTDRPVMIREVKPAIKGVIVIAEGAYDSNVKANITKAVEAGLGIPSYKITVLPQRK